MTPGGELLIAGASARAAASSARRAGWVPHTLDLFADLDTRRLAESAHACPPDGYPDALPALAARLPPMPWLYTGGLENRPDLVAAISATRPLIGNPPATLAKVRDRDWLAATLAEVGVAMPERLPPDAPTPAAGRWLAKPRGSAGGRGVRVSPPGEVAPGLTRERFVEGVVNSTVYRSEGGRCEVFGSTRQLAGSPALNAPPFAYCGSVGPIDPGEALPLLHRAGAHLTARAGLTGVWGLDWIAAAGGPVALEVNPRYPASVEVLELSYHRPLWTSQPPASDTPLRLVGKAVFYAAAALDVPAGDHFAAELDACRDPWRVPAWADLPPGGSRVPTGWPVATRLVAGVSVEAVTRELLNAAEVPPWGR